MNSGSSSAGLTVLVLQSGDQLSPPGDAVTLGCRLAPGVAMSSCTMFWYRQSSHAAALEFVAMEYAQSSGSFQTLIDSAKNSFSLLITELSANDSSTYYCAARHSGAGAAGAAQISANVNDLEQEGTTSCWERTTSCWGPYAPSLIFLFPF